MQIPLSPFPILHVYEDLYQLVFSFLLLSFHIFVWKFGLLGCISENIFLSEDHRARPQATSSKEDMHSQFLIIKRGAGFTDWNKQITTTNKTQKLRSWVPGSLEGRRTKASPWAWFGLGRQSQSMFHQDLAMHAVMSVRLPPLQL